MKLMNTTWDATEEVNIKVGRKQTQFQKQQTYDTPCTRKVMRYLNMTNDTERCGRVSVTYDAKNNRNLPFACR